MKRQSSDQVKLVYPNIYLFAYYLHNITEPTISEEKNDKDDWLWYQCNTFLNNNIKPTFNFKIQDLLELEPKIDYPCLNLIKGYQQTDSYSPFDFYSPFLLEEDKITRTANINTFSNSKNFHRKHAIVYALQLYSSYAVGINLIRPQEYFNRRINVAEIAKLNNDNCLLFDPKNKNPGLLGQTLVISVPLMGKDKYKSHERLKSLADRYIDILFPKSKVRIPFARGGELFSSPIFQYGITRQWETYQHVIIWFIKSEETEKQFERFYSEIFDIFLFRARVTNAYRKHRQNIKKAKKYYEKLEDEVKKLRNENQLVRQDQNLEIFQEKLISLPQNGLEYAKILRRIEKYQNDVLIYTRDYAEKLQEIQTISPQEDLSFLSFFNEKTCVSFQEEITAELEYFHHGFSLIDKAIASIRGQVAIEQARREREEQVLILALGTGIAAGGNMASSIQVALPEHNEGIELKNSFISFFASLIFSILIGLAIWKVFNRLITRKRIIKLNNSFASEDFK